MQGPIVMRILVNTLGLIFGPKADKLNAKGIIPVNLELGIVYVTVNADSVATSHTLHN